MHETSHRHHAKTLSHDKNFREQRRPEVGARC
jgi:hypothetical protein